MQNSTLFQLANEPPKLDLNRKAPVIWLKRFVILSSLGSKKAIRNIPFRRGLNVIQTRKMKPQGGPVSGHGVGKTLLTRLIRYSLGEEHFGTEDTQSKILTAFPTLVTVGHWEVAGEDWIVVRQVNDARDKLAFAVKSNDWETAVLDRRLEELPYETFLSACNEAVLSDLPKLQLPKGHTASWRDLLAWLARDDQCGYRCANDWRHPDANSGPSLQREENSLVMQWVMGLMDPDEIECKIQHRVLLENRSAHKKTAAEQRKQMETLWPVLQAKLEVAEDAEVATQQSTFNSFRPADHVAERIESLEQSKDQKKRASKTPELEAKVDSLQAQLADCKAGIESCTNLAQFIGQQIAELEQDPFKLSTKRNATPQIAENIPQPSEEPIEAQDAKKTSEIDDHLTGLRQQLDSQNQQLAKHQSAQQQIVADLTKTQSLLAVERNRIASALSDIDQSVGRWKAFEDDAKIFQDLSDSYATTTRMLTQADSEIERSLHVQEDLRAKKLQQVNVLSFEYEQLLKKIFGEQTSGSVKIDANGLHPNPDHHLAPAGAVLSVMMTVLAFDIASLSTSMKGIGHHPRFLIHDSPREGNMDTPLFTRLLEIVHLLEKEFNDPKNVSFQYIITTATPPPKHLATKPFVAETLDAKSDKGLLLKQKF